MHATPAATCGRAAKTFAVGDIAVARGTMLGPAHIGVLATVGVGTPPVHRVPRVAILTSGDELVDVDRFDEVLRGDRIVSSNSYTLTSAAVRAAGAEPVYLGIAPDDPVAYERPAARRARLRSARHSRAACPSEHSTSRKTSCEPWARSCISGACACGPARRSDSGCSARCRGSDFPETRCPPW